MSRRCSTFRLCLVEYMSVEMQMVFRGSRKRHHQSGWLMVHAFLVFSHEMRFMELPALNYHSMLSYEFRLTFSHLVIALKEFPLRAVSNNIFFLCSLCGNNVAKSYYIQSNSCVVVISEGSSVVIQIPLKKMGCMLLIKVID